MAARSKILFVFGTRPEAIKLAPLIAELQAHDRRFRVRVCVTAQHRELLDFVLRSFEIEPDHDLNLMRPDQTLPEVTTGALTGLDAVLKRERPDLVVVQGDTTSAMAAALAAFYLKIRVAHVEAGLRTYDLSRPYPEELNRQVIDRIADFLFAPTKDAAENLRREALPPPRVFTVGNTGIDALLHVKNHLGKPASHPRLSAFIGGSKSVLLTLHRRESFGAPMASILRAVARLAREHPDAQVVFPVHPNPSVQKAARAAFKSAPNVRLLPPLSYPDFVAAMAACDLILTDSGGVQEEAPYLKKPFLVLREVTERPEGIALGFGEVVGFAPDRIYGAAARILKNGWKPPRATPPYGDGHASARIRRILEQHL